MKYLSFFFLTFFTLIASAQNHSLRFFVEQARQNSPLIKDYQSQILSLRLDSQILRATLRPQVNFISNNSFAPTINGFGYDAAITNGGNVSALVQASKNFFRNNNVAAQYFNITLQGRALSDTIRLSEQDLRRGITDQYITAYGDLALLDYNTEVLDILHKEDAVLKKLTQASIYKQTDYLSFYVTLQQQELNRSQLQIQYNADYLILNYLAGIVDTAITRIERPDLSDSVQYDFYNSVFYQRFVTDSLRLANEKAIIRYSYQPRLSVYTDGGYNTSLTIPQAYKSFGFSAGLNLAIPIYDGHQRQLRFAQVDIRERTRITRREFFVNQYRQQIAQFNQQLHATDLLVTNIQKQIEYTHTLILANSKLLSTGDIRITDYVLAINNYLNARNLLNQNLINRLRIVNQINYWNR